MLYIELSHQLGHTTGGNLLMEVAILAAGLDDGIAVALKRTRHRGGIAMIDAQVDDNLALGGETIRDVEIDEMGIAVLHRTRYPRR